MPKSCKYKTYQEGYIDGFNRCIEMIEKLQLSLVYKGKENGKRR